MLKHQIGMSDCNATYLGIRVPQVLMKEAGRHGWKSLKKAYARAFIGKEWEGRRWCEKLNCAVAAAPEDLHVDSDGSGVPDAVLPVPRCCSLFPPVDVVPPAALRSTAARACMLCRGGGRPRLLEGRGSSLMFLGMKTQGLAHSREKRRQNRACRDRHPPKLHSMSVSEGANL